MMTIFNIRSLSVLISVFLMISIFAQKTGSSTVLKRSTVTVPTGKIVYTKSSGIVVYDTVKKTEVTIPTPMPPMPNFTWGGSKIAFTTSSTLSTIYFTNLSDSVPMAQNTTVTGFSPSISMDGGKIAFVAYPSMALGIMNSDGSNKYEDTTVSPSPVVIRWIPISNNAELSYITSSGSIAKYNLNTKVTTSYNLHVNVNTDNAPTDFFWKPDGSAFVYSDANNEVYIHTVSTSTNSVITSSASDVSPMVKWQPNGNNISYLTSGGLSLYNPSSTASSNVSSFTSSPGFDWVDDSNNIVLSDGTSKLGIYNISTDTITAMQYYDYNQDGILTDVMGVVMPQWIPSTTAITTVSPYNIVDNQGLINITLSGKDFPVNPVVKLNNSISVNSIVSSSPSQIIFNINAGSLIAGQIYSVDVFDSISMPIVSIPNGLKVYHANTAPTITPAPLSDITVDEDSGPYTFNITVTAGGTLDQLQTIQVKPTCDNPSLIDTSTPLPELINSTTGLYKITIIPAANQYGKAMFTISVIDNGGTLVTFDDGTTATAGSDTTKVSFNYTINAVNDPPSFDKIDDILTSATDPFDIIINNVSAGGNGTESTQVVSISAVSLDPTLLPDPTFSYIDGVCHMTISPISETIGVTYFDVTVSDGTPDPTNNSYTQRVKYTSAFVNTPPQFDIVDSQQTSITYPQVNEDGVLTLFISSIMSGSNALENQTISWTVASSNVSLIPSPALLPLPNRNLQMVFTPLPDANGTTTITITAKDNGGTLYGGADTTIRQFSITVNPVNDPPTIASVPTTVPAVSGNGVENSFILSGTLYVGPGNESSQSVLGITPTTSTPDLISNLRIETVDNINTLYYTPRDNQSGDGIITITIQDSGGTLEGATNDRTSYKVTIPIIAKPAIPTFSNIKDGDYTSGDDILTFKSIAIGSYLQYEIFKQDINYPEVWTTIIQTGWSASDTSVTVAIPTAMKLSAGQWKLKIKSTDKRGGATESVPVTVIVPSVLPPKFVSNSLYLIGMPVLSTNPVQLPDGYKIAKYSPVISQYVDNTFPVLTNTTFEENCAYWVRSSSEANNLKFTGPIITGNKSIPLHIGWNLIPNPYFNDIIWSVNNIQIFDTNSETSKSIANASDFVLPYVWKFEANNTEAKLGHYALVFDKTVIPGINNTIPVWGGFWVKAYKECEIIIPNPNNQYMSRLSKRNLSNGWSTRILASSNSGSAEVVVGVSGSSCNLTLSNPPSSPAGSAINIAATRNGSQLAADLISENDIKEWTLVINKNEVANDSVVLSWPDLSSINGKETISLTDVSTGKTFSINGTKNYTVNFASGVSSRTIKLAIVKRTASVLQISNIHTDSKRNGGQVKFDLSSPAAVTMSVRNLVGRLITTATLNAETAGTQTMSWNTDGKSAGRYLIELKAADNVGRSIRASSFIFIK